MQTHLMQEPVLGLAWLERYASSGVAPERITLESYPFTLGRNPTCDLPIDSAKVSREHAVIRREEGQTWIEDLGSTNGTFLNGHRVDRAALSDGDVLVVADVSFTFYSGRTTAARATATQVLDLASPGAETVRSAADLILGVRRLSEALVHRAVEMRFRPIVDLARGRVLGYAAEGCWYTGRAGADPLLAVECRLTGQVRRLERTWAVEAAADWGGEHHLFTRVDASELGDATLTGSLVQLRRRLPNRHTLVVEWPEGAMSLPAGAEMFNRLHGEGIRIATGALSTLGGAGGASPTKLDFLILPEVLLNQLARRPERRGQIEAAIRTARHAGADAVAWGVRSEDEAALCRELGCRFGCGDHLGPARTTVDAPRASRPGTSTDLCEPVS